jgi:hypothetical protein
LGSGAQTSSTAADRLDQKLKGAAALDNFNFNLNDGGAQQPT